MPHLDATRSNKYKTGSEKSSTLHYNSFQTNVFMPCVQSCFIRSGATLLAIRQLIEYFTGTQCH